MKKNCRTLDDMENIILESNGVKLSIYDMDSCRFADEHGFIKILIEGLFECLFYLQNDCKVIAATSYDKCSKKYLYLEGSELEDKWEKDLPSCSDFSD